LSQDEGFFSNCHCTRQCWVCRCRRFLRSPAQILYKSSSSLGQSLLVAHLYDCLEKYQEADAYTSTAKAGLRLTTCSKSKSTITKTLTVQPSATQTVTVTQTASSTVTTYVTGKMCAGLFTDFPSNVQRTVQKTVTSTTTSHTTLVQTTTSTAQTTLVVPVTTTATQAVTAYVPFTC
jgi:hypothetical protein